MAVWPHEVSAASQTVQGVVGGAFVQAVLDADVQGVLCLSELINQI